MALFRNLGPFSTTAIGHGEMPLTIENNRGHEVGIETQTPRFSCRHIDTAWAYYCSGGEEQTGEKLVREALETWKGPKDEVLVATKVGHFRNFTDGRPTWDVDGRPENLIRRGKESALALGVDTIDLLYFHRPDPKVPYNESVEAIKQLVDEGVAQEAGISNASIEQIDIARGILGDNTLVYSTDRIDDNFAFATPAQDYQNLRLTYDGSREGMEYETGDTPFPIQRWEDVQNDPKLKAYFEDLWQDIHVQQYTHSVVATNDLSSVPAFHLGSAAISEGRLITPEEYASGAKACVISEQVAENQQWKVGDKLNMQLFESDYIPNAPFVPKQPIYDAQETPFISEGEFEIVGIYSLYPYTGYAELAPDTLDFSPHTIFVPTNSIAKPREQKDVLIHGSTFSVKIKNGSVEAFLDDMEAKGLTTPQPNQYTPHFTFYDQGYSAVKSSLLSMNSTAKLLLLLSSILLLMVCILAAYFFWQNQRQTVGIFRLLGGTKKQAVSAVLLCAMVLTILGSAAGGISGYVPSCAALQY